MGPLALKSASSSEVKQKRNLEEIIIFLLTNLTRLLLVELGDMKENPRPLKEKHTKDRE